MKSLINTVCDRLERGLPVALAEVVAGQGSTPRGAGSRLLADGAGLVAGTVGGGLVEAQTLAACAEALAGGKARLLDITMTGEMAAQSEMICGGRLRILVEALTKDDVPFFLALREALNEEGALLVTDISDPEQPRRSGLAYGQDKTFGAPLPESLRAALSLGNVDHNDYFVSQCLPPDRLILAGGGHVSRPTAQVAALAGFSVTVLDDRPEFSQANRFPWAGRVLTTPEYRDCFADLAPDARTAIVIVTRGHLFDAAVLRQALETQAGYIGMIGSARKRAEVYAALRGQGVDEARLKQVRCPIGLSIAAETPEEIAVSIVAECISWRRSLCRALHPSRP